MLDVDEIRNMTDEELSAKLQELEDERAELRVQQAIAPPENPMRIREIRRTIARIKTIKRERELEEAS